MSAAELIQDQILLRPPAASEAPFIFRNWLDSYFPEQADRVKKTVFYEGHHALIEKLIARAKLVVACNVEAPDFLYGFACGERFGEPLGSIFTLHYVYVKQRFRRNGIASRLVTQLRGDADACFHSHDIERGSREAIAAWNGFRASLSNTYFNPYAGGLTQ